MPRWTCAAWAAVVAAGVALAAPADPDVARALDTIKSVGREGKNNDAAAGAVKVLAAAGAPALFPALAATDDADPTAANWLRAAVDGIAEAEAKAGRPLPADQLEAFAKDAKFAPSARRHAYELLVKKDPAAAGRLLPGFLNDPSPDLRRDAIDHGMKAAKLLGTGSGRAETDAHRKLFDAARDKDQVDELAKKLDQLGAKVSVTEHFAFLTRWHLVGPFPSEKGKALTTAHPPETARDVAGTFKGKDGADLTWKPAATADKYGSVDLNALVGKHKDAAVYALAVVTADKPTPAEIRVASPNAVVIFLDGKRLFEREEYHHGDALDYHVGRGTLVAGENVVVLKVCQNNQTDAWAQGWKFQARVCDGTGGPLPGLMQVVPGTVNAAPFKLGTVTDPAPAKEEKK